MATIRMVAEKCGLSIAAVSKALNHRPGIGQQKAEMVRSLAREMGYYPNAAARTLKTHRSHNLGIVYRNNLAHEFFSVMLEGVHAQAEQLGYDITFLNNDLAPSNMSYYDHARNRQCDGVIIVQSSFAHDAVMRLIDSEIPVVSVDCPYEGRTAILSNNESAMHEIIRYLKLLGHSRIAYIHGQLGGVTDVRLEGFHQGCKACGITVPDAYVKSSRYHDVDSAGQATRELLALTQRPTCILYPDDVSYLGGMAEIERQGLSIPEDISCFGFDGVFMAGALRPRLSTYKQDSDEMGRQAAREIASCVEHPESYIPHTVTVAGSIQYGDTVKDLN